jgi:transposase-like protein
VGQRVVVSELPTKVTHDRTHDAMTQDHSALLVQLDALKSADAGAVFAELIRAGLQALIEAEATETIGAGRYERSGGRATHRNGHRAKTVSTTAGDIEVGIPKLPSIQHDSLITTPRSCVSLVCRR